MVLDRILAENAHGLGVPAETLTPIKISMKPSAPGKLQFVESTISSVTLAWTKPEHDGGSEITG